ncbi:MAG: deoxyribodipyrimidine photo-lyase/cryptochrome family protein [Gammaproteobacteria bacterium]|nr:deoxyribodipyrimidine photo-lyase/cryptochrome family protein [Gammaproteobacteria bacterium]
MSSFALVWLKRDLRIADHAPLAAAASCDAAVALYVVEPQWITSPECDAQHLAFARANLVALRVRLAERGLPLLIRWGAVPEVLSTLRRQVPFDRLFSHEETGPGWSFQRDRAVARWCRRVGVYWREWPQNGVIRGLRDRNGWAARWQRRMDASCPVAPARWRGVASPEPGEWPDDRLAAAGLGACRPLPGAGETAAAATLESFLTDRGRHYRRHLSSPLTAAAACSRISAYLAFGVLSVRQTHQATEARIAELLREADPNARSFAQHLRAFAARLRWHCHFIQKLECEPAIESRNLARSFDGLREPAFDPNRFEAWRAGRTGYPMVDACMRCLNATGWLNFRMRAMLVSFAAYHLWLHWREPGLHLARQFLDFEPGIHWSQMQMQSGTTGINALRIYSPDKQRREHDPHGVFIRRWLPEYGTAAYPPPIVEERIALAAAKERMYAVREGAAARAEALIVQRMHGSRRSGLPSAERQRRRRKSPSEPPRQGQLFAEEPQ